MDLAFALLALGFVVDAGAIAAKVPVGWRWAGPVLKALGCAVIAWSFYRLGMAFSDLGNSLG